MNKQLWISLCEAVWNKEVVVDMSNVLITTVALERWFSGRALKIKRSILMKLAKQLSDMLHSNLIQRAEYGEHPEIHLEHVANHKDILDSDITLLQTFTPELLEKAARRAGFDLGVYAVNSAHPLSQWD